MDDSQYIRCKYCRFFCPYDNGCYLRTQYDQILSRNDNIAQYTRYQDTQPTYWCSHFHLTVPDQLTRKDNPFRKDGTPKVDFENFPDLKLQLQQKEAELYGPPPSSGCLGCYVATCVYGSYDCPQVWTLRRFRDNILAQSLLGRLFIRTYYAVSPTVVKLFGKTKPFQIVFRKILDNVVQRLHEHGIENTPYDDQQW